MDPEPNPERPRRALPSLVEHFTLLTLVAAVSLFTVGRLQTWRFLADFGITGTGVETSWESQVFSGAMAFVNMVLAPSPILLVCLVPLLALAACLLALRWARRGPGRARGAAALAAGLGAVASYLTFLIFVGSTRGILTARNTRTGRGVAPPARFVFTPEASASLPPGLLEANARAGLQTLTTTADSFYLYDPVRNATYAVPSRLVLCRTFQPAPGPSR